MVYRNDGILMLARKDTLQNLFLIRSEQNRIFLLIKVEDEINFPEYVDVTDEAKDFILGIMKKKPEERMEMKQIMRHPFILKYLK